MKDALHHRKQVQKKVVQSVRKSESLEAKSLNGSPNLTLPRIDQEPTQEKRENTNHRVPRIIERPQYH
jgi:hypothetical protein